MITVKVARGEATFKDTQTGTKVTLTTARIKNVLAGNYRGCSCVTMHWEEIENEYDIHLSREVLARTLEELVKND